MTDHRRAGDPANETANDHTTDPNPAAPPAAARELPAEIPAAPPGDAHTRALLARLPQYQQIAEDLRRRIETGDLPPGAPLPSETEINQRYQVSRITARNAVRALRAAGLVVTEHGRGTYVRTTGPGGHDLDPTITVTGGDRYLTWDSAGWTEVEQPTRYRTEARADTARLLDLTEGEPLFVHERLLRAEDDAVTVAHRTYLPFAVALGTPLETDPFQNPAHLYATLAAAGHTLHWRDRTTARMPTPDETTVLGVPEGVPLLLHQRLTLSGGRPLALEHTRLPADRVAITADTTPVKTTKGQTTRTRR